MASAQKFLSVVLMTSILGCTIMTENENANWPSSVPLKFVSMDSSWPDRYLPKLFVEVDGQKRELLLDLGAPSSMLMKDEFSKKYKSISSSKARSASGKTQNCELIRPNELLIGGHKILNPKMKRCSGRIMDILGLDVLGRWTFQVDLKDRKLSFLNEWPKNQQYSPLLKVQSGHIILPVKIGTKNEKILFDTGADITVIDQDYVTNNPECFRFVRNEENEDGNGVKSPSKLYICDKIKIGNLELANVEVSAVEFPQFLKDALEGAPGILGNNVIEKAKWTFNLKLNKWSFELY